MKQSFSNRLRQICGYTGQGPPWTHLKLFFADTAPPDHQGHPDRLYQAAPGFFKGAWAWIFLEQCINSAIVGGISALSSLATGGSWKSGLIGFGLTFLIELRKYRAPLPPPAS